MGEKQEEVENMPKIEDGGYILDDSTLEPYKIKDDERREEAVEYPLWKQNNK